MYLNKKKAANSAAVETENAIAAAAPFSKRIARVSDIEFGTRSSLSFQVARRQLIAEAALLRVGLRRREQVRTRILRSAPAHAALAVVHAERVEERQQITHNVLLSTPLAPPLRCRPAHVLQVLAFWRTHERVRPERHQRTSRVQVEELESELQTGPTRHLRVVRLEATQEQLQDALEVLPPNVVMQRVQALRISRVDVALIIAEQEDCLLNTIKIHSI